jgi:hypothetical protein
MRDGIRKRIKVRYTIYLILLLSPISYLFSTLYTEGDQVHYRLVYELISDKTFIESYLIYQRSLNSSEIGHFLLTWIGSRLVEKDLFVTLLNTLLLIYGTLFLHKITRRSPLLILFLLLSNYYIFTLMFSAERLKVAFIFLFIFMYYYENLKLRIPFLFMAILSHVSIIILIASSFFPRLIKSLLRTVLTGKLNLFLLKYIIIIIFVLMIFFDHIYNKVVGHAFLYFDINNSFKILGLMLFIWPFIRNHRVRYVYIMLLMAVSAIIIGDSRVNIYAFLYSQYHYLHYENIKSLPFIIMAFYLFLKTIQFVYNVIHYGDAYYLSS